MLTILNGVKNINFKEWGKEMENENIKREDFNDEVVDETHEEVTDIAEETTEAVEEITEEPAEYAIEEVAEDEVDLIGDDKVDWTGDDGAPEEPNQAEPVQDGNNEVSSAEVKESKKTRIKIGIIVAAAIAAVLAIAAFFVCYTEGVGGNTAVNRPITAIQTGENGFFDKLDNIKFENPVVTVFDVITGKNKDTVIKVNGISVDKNVFNFFTNSTGLNCVYSLIQMGMVNDVSAFNWEALDQTTGFSYKELSKSMALDSIVPVYATIAEGEKRGITLDEEDEKKIKDWIDEQKKNYGDEFEEVVKKSGYADEATLYEIQRMQVYMQKVYEDISANIDSYVSPKLKASLGNDKVTVKHILIKADTEEEKVEAKKEAEKVLAKAKAGEDFDKLIEEFNDDPGATDEGYTFANDGTMVQEFADASFALEVGSISELVETSYGYHIIKRLERAVTADDYIENLGKTVPVKIKKGAYNKTNITIDLNDYFGAPSEESTDDIEGNVTEEQAE